MLLQEQGEPSPFALTNARVIIPTTQGPVDILAIEPEVPEVGKSVVCINFATDQAGISGGYDAFVKRPTGVIHRLLCKEPYRPFRMDISAPVDAGDSWQLAGLLAHAIQILGGDTQFGLVWASATVTSDLRVGSVGNVSEKLLNSEPLFLEARSAGLRIRLVLSRDNAQDLAEDTAARLAAMGVEIVLVSRIDEAMAFLDLPKLETRAAAADAGQAQVWEGNPYRGLEAFSPEDRAIFFGRGRASEEAIDLLRRAAAGRRPFLLVHGSSGAGKSSFLRAGVAGDLERQAAEAGLFRTAIMTPAAGATPLGALLSACSSVLGVPVPSIAALLAAPALSDKDRGPKTTLLLVIDQLEEALDGSLPDEDVRLFDEAVAEVVRSGRVWVIASIRSDAMGSLDRTPGIAQLAAPQRVYRLDRPRPSELAQIIEAPALLAGKKLESASLIDGLVDAASRSPDSLPLLQVALTRFFEAEASPKVLTAATLERVGGFEGAVAAWADDVYEALIRTGHAATDIDRALLSLARIDLDTNVAMSRTVAVEPGSPSAAIYDELVAQRLATKTDGAGAPRVRLAHDCLISQWGTLSALAAAQTAAIAIRDQVEARARAREESNGDLIAKGSLLEAAANLLPGQGYGGPVGLTERGASYVRASLDQAQEADREDARRIQHTRKLQRRSWAAMAAVAAVIALVAVVAFQSRLSGQQRDADLFGARALEAIQAGNFERAMRYGLKANPPGNAPWDHHSPEIDDILLAAQRPSQLKSESPVLAPAAATRKPAMSPDGSRLVMVSPPNSLIPGSRATLEIWDVKSRKLALRLQLEIGLMAYDISRDGSKLVYFDWHANLRVISLSNGETLRQFELNKDIERHTLRYVSFANGDKSIIYIDVSGGVDVYDVATGSLQSRYDAYFHDAFTLSPDGSKLLAISGGSYALLSAMDGGVIYTNEDTKDDSIFRAEFSPNGSRYILLRDKSSDLVNAWTGKRAWRSSASTDVDFSPDSDRVALVKSKSVWIYNFINDYDFDQIDFLANIVNLSYLGSGRYLLTSDVEGKLTVYDRRSERPIQVNNDQLGEKRILGVSRESGQIVLLKANEISFMSSDLNDGSSLIEARADDQGLRDIDVRNGVILTTGNSRALFRSLDLSLVHQFDVGGNNIGTAFFVGNSQYILTTTYSQGTTLFSLDGAKVKVFAKGGYTDSVFNGGNSAIIGKEVWDLLNLRMLAALPDVYSVTKAVSPDGLRSFTSRSSEDESLPTLWDLSAGQSVATFTEVNGACPSASFSPDGAILATSCADRKVTLWDAKTGKQIKIVLEGVATTSIAFSPDGKYLAISTEDGKRIWQLSGGMFVTKLFGHKNDKLTFASKSGYFYTVSKTDVVSLYRVGSTLPLINYDFSFSGSSAYGSALFTTPSGTVFFQRSGGSIVSWNDDWLFGSRPDPETIVCSKGLTEAARLFTPDEISDPVMYGAAVEGATRLNACERPPALSLSGLKVAFQDIWRGLFAGLTAVAGQP